MKNEKNNLPTVKHGSRSVVLCGCFASSGTGDLQRVADMMHSIKYQQILGGNVMLSVRKLKLEHHCTVKTDNDRKQSPSKSTKAWFQKKVPEVSRATSHSSYVKLIEHLWLDLKKVVPTNHSPYGSCRHDA